MQTITFNGIPIESYGIAVSDISGWLDVPARAYAAVQAPLRPGLIPLSTGSTIEARTLGLKLYVQPTSLKDRRDKLSVLVGALAGRIEVSTLEDPAKVCFGYLRDVPVRSPFRPFVTPEVLADLSLVCFDPLWYDVEPATVGTQVAAAKLTLAVGSAPIRRLRAQLVGAAVNPILVLARPNGIELQRMTITTTLGANDWLDIDCDAYTITKWTAGVATSVLGALAATETFFEIDEPAAVQLSSTVGALTVAYYRSWWS